MAAKFFSKKILQGLIARSPEAVGPPRNLFCRIVEIGEKSDRLASDVFRLLPEGDAQLHAVLHRCAVVLRDLSTSVETAIGALSDQVREKIATR